MPGTTKRVIGGRYEIERRIGIGGMGELLLGHDPILKRSVAIKLLREDLAERGERPGLAKGLLKRLSGHHDEIRTRFINEAKTAAGLTHPNIVVIYDVVDDPQGLPFIVMEYVQGQTLQAIIGKGEPVDLTTKLRLMEQLCDGLGYAHDSEQRIVHRDIKPANLMVDRKGNVKILDFGIARIADSSLTQPLSRMGTPNYMAPEQFIGRGVDFRCDIWAVGAVLYEFLSSTQAFPTLEGDADLEWRVRNQHPPSIDTLPACVGIDSRIVRVVNRALAKEPARRYESLRHMGAEIQEVRLSLGATTGTSGPATGYRGGLGTPAQTPIHTPLITPMQRTTAHDLESVLQHRSEQIEVSLEAARQALDASNFEGALRACNQVFLFDPRHPEALGLVNRAKTGLDDQRVRELLASAETAMVRGQLDLAATFVDSALALRPESPTVIRMQLAVDEALLESAVRRVREEEIDKWLVQAERALADDDPQTALQAAEQVLRLDRASLRGQTLQNDAYQLAARHQHQKEQAERAARALAAAEGHFTEGRLAAAIATLEVCPVQTSAVAERLDFFRAAADEAERREAEERRVRARALDDLLEQAQRALSDDNLEGALYAAEQALAQDPGSVRGLALQKAANDAFGRRQHEKDLSERAFRAIAAARARAAAGHHAVAVKVLEDFPSPTPVVQQALAELRAELSAAARREDDRTAARIVEAARHKSEVGLTHEAVADLERGPAHPIVADALTDLRARAETAEREAGARARQAVEAARARFDGGARVAAIGDLEAYSPPHKIVHDGLADLRRRLDETERAEGERVRRIVAAARDRFSRGEYAEAIADLESDPCRAPAIETAAVDLRAEYDRIREVAANRNRQAHDLVEASRSLDEAGHRDQALAALRQFSPAHPLVTAAIQDIERRAAVLSANAGGSPSAEPAPAAPDFPAGPTLQEGCQPTREPAEPSTPRETRLAALPAAEPARPETATCVAEWPADEAVSDAGRSRLVRTRWMVLAAAGAVVAVCVVYYLYAWRDPALPSDRSAKAPAVAAAFGQVVVTSTPVWAVIVEVVDTRTGLAVPNLACAEPGQDSAPSGPASEAAPGELVTPCRVFLPAGVYNVRVRGPASTAVAGQVVTIGAGQVESLAFADPRMTLDEAVRQALEKSGLPMK